MNFIKKLLKKKLVMGIACTVVIGIGYYGYESTTSKTAAPRYITSPATRGMLSVSVSGSGQITNTSQIDLKPNASGTLIGLNVVQGQTVSQGQLIAYIDSRAAQRAVTDAQTSLETAKLNMQKVLEPIDELTKLQQENSLISARNSLQKTKDDLIKSYDDGFTTVSNAFLNLPTVMTGLQDIIMGSSANSNQWNIDFYADSVKNFDAKATDYREDAYQSYLSARKSYDENFIEYKTSSRASDPEAIEALVSKTHATSLAISEAVKNTNNLIQFYKDKLTERNLQPISLADTQLSQLNNFTGTANSNISGLFSSKRSIETGNQAIDDATRSLAEKQATIDKANVGADVLDIRSLQISIDQKQNALQDAKDKLTDYYLRAPFKGIIAKVNVKKGDTISSGTAMATLISEQQVAEVSLNEVDVAAVKNGQKTTITFDAIEELTLTGTVAEIDTLGTVSQGVVTYSVRIVLDTKDERVKPGMSASVAIITNTKIDVIMVPNTAIKNDQNGSYIQQLENGNPISKNVEMGLSNDTNTEIISGVNEGDEVVTQTITSATKAAAATSSQRSGTTALPGLGGTGGAVRAFRAN